MITAGNSFYVSEVTGTDGSLILMFSQKAATNTSLILRKVLAY
jgi:hypothetical protein